MTPGISSSTGFSRVRMLSSGRFSSRSIAFRVVDFPEPVGPDMTIIPEGIAMTRSSSKRVAASKAREPTPSLASKWLLSRIRIVTW
jgi:hypothetical protein